MKRLIAGLGLIWALGNLYVAYLFLTSGVAAKNVHKGLGVQASLVLGGILVAVFALFLLAEGVSLALSRAED